MVVFVAAGIAALWAGGYLICYVASYNEFDGDSFIVNIFYLTVLAGVISFQLVQLTSDPENMGYRYLGERADVSAGMGVLMWLGMFTLLLVVIMILIHAVAHVSGDRDIVSFVCVVVLTLYTSVFTAILMIYPGVLGYEKIPKEEQQTVEEISINSADLESEGR